MLNLGTTSCNTTSMNYRSQRNICLIIQKKLQIISMDCRYQINIYHIIHKIITNYFYGLHISKKYMPNCFQKHILQIILFRNIF
jgi:hypothetical protein